MICMSVSTRQGGTVKVIQTLFNYTNLLPVYLLLAPPIADPPEIFSKLSACTNILARYHLQSGCLGVPAPLKPMGAHPPLGRIRPLIATTMDHQVR